MRQAIGCWLLPDIALYFLKISCMVSFARNHLDLDRVSGAQILNGDSEKGNET